MFDDELLLFIHEPARLVLLTNLAAVTKADLPGAAEVQRELAAELGREVLLISAVTGQGLNTLVGTIARALDKDARPW